MPALTILIVSHNTRDHLDRCLRSIAGAPPATSHEIVVVDNASADGSADLLRREWPRVRLIEPGRNLGFGRGCNVGVRATGSELVLLLNSDTIVPPGAIDALVTTLVARPDTAAVGPRITDTTGRAELSFGAMAGPWSELWRKTVGALADRGVAPAVAWIERVTSRPAVVDWVTGACLLVRRQDAEAAGLFDERYFMYFEDIDFCAAIRARGRRIRFVPAVRITHHRGRSSAAAPAAIRTAYRHSQLMFYAKHHPRWLPWLRAYLRARGKSPGESADTNGAW
jgi:hypothetical protein